LGARHGDILKTCYALLIFLPYIKGTVSQMTN